MRTQTLIVAATGAGTAVINVSSSNPATLVGWGFSTDTVDLQVSYDNGTTFVDIYKDGTQVQLSDTNNPVTVYGPGIFKINKGVTTGTVGVAIMREP